MGFEQALGLLLALLEIVVNGLLYRHGTTPSFSAPVVRSFQAERMVRMVGIRAG
jgi:hypothetical protein